MRVLAAILLLVTAACDNVIQPLEQGSDGQFSLFGYLDSAADTQFVRLDPVLASARAPRTALTGARVVSTDDLGFEQEWTHRVQLLEDGSPGDIFYAVFRPSAGRRYRIEASMPSGFSADASVTLPELPVLDPGLPRGDTLNLMQNIRLLGVTADPLRLTVLYDVRRPEDEESIRVPVDYGTGNGRADNGWQFDVFLRRDQATVLSRINRNIDSRDVSLIRIGLRAELLSPEWKEESPTNISNGRGFFGAIGRYDVSWSLTSDAVETMGFVDGQ